MEIGSNSRQTNRLLLGFKSLITILLLLVVSQSMGQAPGWKWVSNASGSDRDEPWDLAVDNASGDIVLVGEIKALNPRYPSITSIYGGDDGLVAKYDSTTGAVIWAFNIGNNNNERVEAVSIDPTGNIYITGRYKGNNAEFRGTSGPSVMLSSNGGNDDPFLAKYNSAGQLIWVRTNSSGTDNDEGQGIHATASGVVMTGRYKTATGITFGPWTSVANTGDHQFFAVKYSAAGNFEWGISGSSNDKSEGNDVVQVGGDTYIIGEFEQDPITFYDYSGNSPLPTMPISGRHDIFLLSVDNSGGFNWQQAVQGPDDERAAAITAAGNDLFITGAIEEDCAFPGLPGTYGNPTHKSMFFSSHDQSTGNTNWVECMVSSNDHSEGRRICTNNNGDLYIVGDVKGTLDLSAYGYPNITAGGDDVVALFNYDVNGVFQWAKEVEGNNDVRGNGIDVYDQTPVVVAGGWYEGTVNFDSLSFANAGNKDAWVGLIDGCEHFNNTLSANQTICQGQIPAPFTGSVAGGGSGTIQYIWQVSTDNINFFNASGLNTQQGYTVGTPINDTTYFRRLVTSTGCPNDTNISATLTVFVDAIPGPAVAGPDQNICQGTATLAATPPTTGTGAWTIFGSGTITNPTANNSTVTGITPGTDTLIWTVSNGVCPSVTDTMLIVHDQPPGPAAAGPDQTICASNSTLAATPPTTGTGTWTQIAGAGTIASPNDPNSAVTGLGTGTNTFVWTVANGACPSVTDTVNINVNAIPGPVNAGSDQNICQGTTSLAATPPTTGTGAWTILGSGTITNPTANNSTVTGIMPGTDTLIWTVSNGVCPSVTDTMLIVHDQSPGPAAAGPDQTICASNSTLAATPPTTGYGTWTQIVGAGTIASPNNPNSAVTGLGTATNTFVWTVANGACPSVTDTVNIFVDPFPGPAAAGPDQNICQGTTTLAATPPTTGIGTWTILGSGTITNPTANNSTVTGITPGTDTLIWTVSNGVCPSVTDTMLIVHDQPPGPAAAGPDQTICVSNTTLAATPPTTGTGTWMQIAGAGTIASPNAPNSAVTGLGTATNTFVWTVANGACPSVTDTVNINVYATPGPVNAGADQSICQDTLALGATNPLSGVGTWSVISGGGIFSNPNDPNAIISGLQPGINILQWVVSNGLCPDVADSLEIEVFTPPDTANAGFDQQICGQNALLGGNLPVIGTGTWSHTGGSASILNPNSPSSSITNLSPGNHLFIWTIGNGNCPSESDTVEITVFANPGVADAGPDQLICSGNSTLAATPVNAGFGTWNLIAGSGTVQNPNSPNSAVAGLAPGMNLFVWSVSNGVCAMTSDTMVIEVSQSPGPALAGPDQDICADTAQLEALQPAVGTGQWTLISGQGIIQTPTALQPQISNLSNGNNQFVWTVTNGVCPVVSDTVSIFVNPLPSTANAGPDQILSLGTPLGLSGNSPFNGTGIWNILQGNPQIFDLSDPLTTGIIADTGRVLMEWVISAPGCPDSRDSMWVFIYDLIIPTGFSPNGDGQNDFFTINNLSNIGPVHLEVFNRWGTMVFEQIDYQNNWEGKTETGQILADDTYYIVLESVEFRYAGYVVIKR